MSRLGFACGLLSLVAVLGAVPAARAQAPASAASAETEPDVRSAIPAEMRERYANSKWTYPSSEAMANKYPLQALNDNISGAVVLACTILPDGDMDKCGIMAEAPKGYGFGMATAAAFVIGAKVDPSTVEGGIKPGDFYVFTYRWLLN